MIKLEFSDNTAEGVNAQVADYIANVKKKRGGKDEPDAGATGGQNAPAPIMPNMQQGGGFPGPGATTFAPQGPGAVQMGGAFPAAGAQQVAPEVQALVQRIVNRIDWCLTPPPQGGGQSPESVTAWFRTQCGPSAADATMDQIKQLFLPRMQMPGLDNIAKLMNA